MSQQVLSSIRDYREWIWVNRQVDDVERKYCDVNISLILILKSEWDKNESLSLLTTFVPIMYCLYLCFDKKKHQYIHRNKSLFGDTNHFHTFTHCTSFDSSDSIDCKRNEFSLLKFDFIERFERVSDALFIKWRSHEKNWRIYAKCFDKN